MQATNRRGDLHGVVAIGASAGGVEALSRLAAGLSPDVPHAGGMTLHIPPEAPSILARILDRSEPLPAVTGEHGAQLEPAHSYAGSPDRHLLVADHRVVRSQRPTENRHRPAEKAKLARHLADRTHHGLISRHYSARAEESERALTVLSNRRAVNGPDRGDDGG